MGTLPAALLEEKKNSGGPCLLPLTHSSRGKVGAGGAVVPSDRSPRPAPAKESYSLINLLASDTLRSV